MSLASGSIDLKSLKVAGEPNKYITYIGSADGIKVFDGTNSNNYIQINSSGMKVYQGTALASYKVADFGSDIKLYNNGNLRVQLDNDGLTIYDRNGTNIVANFGKVQDASNYTATIGMYNSYHISMTAYGGMSFSTGTKRLGHLSVDGLEWFTNETTPQSMARLGYGQGSNVSGVLEEAPYFTFGTRITSATDYSSSSTYVVGDVCKYNGQLYVCIQKITQGEAWNSTKWSSINKGNWSVVEGIGNEADYLCHVEGSNNKAVGNYNHIEGVNNVIGPKAAAGSIGATHVEGWHNFVNAGYAHAEGADNIVTGNGSHVEGAENYVIGKFAHAQNRGNEAASDYQTVIGKWNYPDYNNTYAFIIGGGEDKTPAGMKNIFTVEWAGNVNIPSGAKYKINNVALSAADVNALATSAAYTRSSAGHLDWSNNTEGDSKVIMKSALAFWNGQYNSTGSNLKYSANGVIIGTTNLSSSGNNHTGISISANSVKTSTFTITRSGYYPICIDRINLGGTGSDKICINKWGITARSDGSVTYEIAYYNPTSTAYSSITIAVYVLWAKL